LLGVVMVKNSLPSSLVTLSITVPVPSGVKGFEDDVGVAVDVSVCAGDVVEIHIEECNTYEEILSAITDWTEYYNYERYQWDLAKLSPAEYYKYLVVQTLYFCFL